MEQTVSEILKKLTLPYAATLLFIIAFLVFGNTLFNGLIGDDYGYVFNNLQNRTVNFALSFGREGYFNGGGQYHALQSLYFSLLYAVFGATPFFYRLLQILLHIASTILLYVLFRKFLSSGIALFAALVFLVHPLQVESVAYIAQTASPLFFLLGIIPLLLSMRNALSAKMLVVVFSLLLLSLFEKETGILFLIMLLVYSFLFAKQNLIKLAIGSFLTLGVYAFFRIYIGQVDLSTMPGVPITGLSLPERLLNMPLIMLYYFKTFFFPKTLVFGQNWIITSVTVATFYLPLLIDAGFFILLCLGGYYIFKYHKHNFKPFLFFSMWFLVGLLFHLQIHPLDATVADRWFYFPMAGLLGLGGLLYQKLAKKLPAYSALSALLAVLIIFPLAVRTIARNSDWHDGLTLYGRDIHFDDNFENEERLGAEYGNRGEYAKALSHLQKSVSLHADELNLRNLGKLYEVMGNIPEARTHYAMALSVKDEKIYVPHKHDIKTYQAYASLLVFYYDSSSAVPLIQDGLTDYPDLFDLWYLLALAEYKQRDTQAALAAASKAYQLDPNEQDTYVYNQIQNNEPLSISFDGKQFTFNSK